MQILPHLPPIGREASSLAPCPQPQPHVLPSPKPVSPRHACAALQEVLQEAEPLSTILLPLGLGTLLGAEGKS